MRVAHKIAPIIRIGSGDKTKISDQQTTGCAERRMGIENNENKIGQRSSAGSRRIS